MTLTTGIFAREEFRPHQPKIPVLGVFGLAIVLRELRPQTALDKRAGGFGGLRGGEAMGSGAGSAFSLRASGSTTKGFHIKSRRLSATPPLKVPFYLGSATLACLVTRPTAFLEPS